MSYDEQMQEYWAQLAAENNQRVGGARGVSSLLAVNWPEVEHYGYDHASKTSQLAVFIGRDALKLKDRELDIVKTAALLHDLGRTKTWLEPDEGHGMASMEQAARLMHADPNAWGDATFINDVCRLIAKHSLSSMEAPPNSEPLLQCLWDAECYESARFAPGTEDGLKVMKARFARVVTPWARDKDNQRIWRKFRGW